MQITEKRQKSKFKDAIRLVSNNIAWVVAVFVLAYAFWQMGAVIAEIHSYYATTGDNASVGEYITYTLQTGMQPILWSLVLFFIGSLKRDIRNAQATISALGEQLSDLGEKQDIVIDKVKKNTAKKKSTKKKD